MSAALDLLALVEAGAELVAEPSGLRVRAAVRLPPALLDRVRAAKPALLVVASGAWRQELSAWPPEFRDLWAERAAIMSADGGLPAELAEQAAFLDVRERVLDPARDAIAALAAAGLGPVVLVGVRAAGADPAAHGASQP